MEALTRKLLHKLPEELAHSLIIIALKCAFFPKVATFEDASLQIELFKRKFSNPIGLAAGFDKNAECIDGLSKQGFGFIECGTVTIMPQYGNPKPRMFRLKEDEAIINRMGFNNKGIDKFINNIKCSRCNIILGVNIGINSNSKTMIEDYIELAAKVKNICDYIVLNISSPNTPILRALNHPHLLDELLYKVTSVAKSDANHQTPIVLKISPDITENDKHDIAKLAITHEIDALIVSNTTTIHRNNLINHRKSEHGGLSGKPLFDVSTKLLEEMYLLTRKKIPLIASGGVTNAKSAYEKIKKGASLVEIYTSIIYQGFSLVNIIKKDLVRLLKEDGFANIKEAIGKSVIG